ncbi:unnamed protein product [Protopolystoma xenopodis]|uniref:Uncharacterized protein n=1 Tax=Protopolystoma xenopodis TaxID=117903 RepID=A0A448WRX1_9PLAT|nr:unnamed protein product [Protopolystoma xenopodis]
MIFPNQGTIFFAMPDGNGLLYSLVGLAESPKSTGRITREVACKTEHTESIKVANWLPISQRFAVSREVIRPEKPDPSLRIQGLDYVDVPANAHKDYKLYFFAYKEGNILIKVTFINEDTGEYQFYELQFRTSRPTTLSTIRLQTSVRRPVTESILLENPLTGPVTFQLNSSLPELQCPNQLHIPAQREGSIHLEFLPLRSGDFTGRLEVSCPELGLYAYQLALVATPAPPEPTLPFSSCSLGQSQLKHVRLVNLSRSKAELTCKVGTHTPMRFPITLAS